VWQPPLLSPPEQLPFAAVGPKPRSNVGGALASDHTSLRNSLRKVRLFVGEIADSSFSLARDSESDPKISGTP
jgi:hypothetical protein